MKIAFLSHNYMDSPHKLDPFRSELVKEFARRTSEFLFLQVNDYFDGEGNFHSEFSRTIVINALKDFAPDLVFSINRSGLNPEVIGILKCPIYSWYVDNPHRFPKNFRGQAPGERIFIASKSTFLLDWMRKDLGNPAFEFEYLPFCANDAVFKPAENPVPESDRCDVSFVGTLWDPYSTVSFLNGTVRSEPERLELLKGFENYLRDYSADIQTSLPKAIQKEWSSSAARTQFDDFISTQSRLTVLGKLTDLNVEIYGNATWAGYALLYSPKLLQAFRTTHINTPEALARLYQRSRVGLSIAHHQAQCGFPIRIMDLLATGVPLVTDRHQEIADLFEEGKAFLAYDDADQASEHVRRILGDPKFANTLRDTGIREIREKHTFPRRVDQILDHAPYRALKRVTIVSEILSPLFLAELQPTTQALVNAQIVASAMNVAAPAPLPTSAPSDAFPVTALPSQWGSKLRKVRKAIVLVGKLIYGLFDTVFVLFALACISLVPALSKRMGRTGDRETLKNLTRYFVLSLSHAVQRVNLEARQKLSEGKKV